MIDYKDLGARVRTLRREQHLTQEELAERTGISPSFMGHIERGSRVASLDTLVALCNTLKASPAYLLAASLEDEFDALVPKQMNANDRRRLSAFLRMANDTIINWNEDDL